jgi:hypothetical protein
MAIAFQLAESHLKLFPFISTAKIQRYVENCTGLLVDGRTIAGMRRSLHRNMVKAAA